MGKTNIDPARFQPYREPLKATLLRTASIALALGSVAAIVQLRRLPAGRADVCVWMLWVIAVLWFSFGGHWVEIAYLNGLRPRLAHLSDRVLVFVRLAVWLIGGALLALGMITTLSLLTTGHWPSKAGVRSALLYGGAFFILVETVPHTVLSLRGRPSFWNGRG